MSEGGVNLTSAALVLVGISLCLCMCLCLRDSNRFAGVPIPRADDAADPDADAAAASPGRPAGAAHTDHVVSIFTDADAAAAPAPDDAVTVTPTAAVTV